MNQKQKQSIQMILIAYFLTMSSTTTYPFWGISESVLISVCLMSGCCGCCYQNKQNDHFKRTLKELQDAQKELETEIQTLSNNGSSVSNIVSALSINMRSPANQHRFFGPRDLQTAYDGQQTEAFRRAPAPLPGSVPDADLPPMTVSRFQANRR